MKLTEKSPNRVVAKFTLCKKKAAFKKNKGNHIFMNTNVWGNITKWKLWTRMDCVNYGRGSLVIFHIVTVWSLCERKLGGGMAEESEIKIYTKNNQLRTNLSFLNGLWLFFLAENKPCKTQKYAGS